MAKYNYGLGSSLEHLLLVIKEMHIDFEGYQVVTVKSSFGQVVFENKCIVEDTLSTLSLDSSKCTLRINCCGRTKFSISLCPNGNVTFNVGRSDRVKHMLHNKTDVEQILQAEAKFYIYIVENMFNITVVKDTYKMELFNGGILHNGGEECLRKMEKDIAVLEDAFPIVCCKTNSRRKHIFCFMSKSKKRGVVRINNRSYNFQDFTKVEDVNIALNKVLKMLK